MVGEKTHSNKSSAGLPRMHPLMLILASMSVLVLMMSVVTLLGWGLIRLVRAVRRAYQERPRYVGIVERYQTPYVEENFKRAGQ